MSELTLEWREAGQLKHYTISDQQPGKFRAGICIGRDPARCDLVLSHPTVSGLHVEIVGDRARNGFYLRNLRETNPPKINGQPLTQAEAMLSQGSTIHLGQLELQVTQLLITYDIPPTVLLFDAESPAVPESEPTASTLPASGANPYYGLMCPRCQQVSAYDRLNFGCPWCGSSLATAVSALLSTNGRTG